MKGLKFYCLPVWDLADCIMWFIRDLPKTEQLLTTAINEADKCRVLGWTSETMIILGAIRFQLNKLETQH